ncbi:MAG TPA: peroxiredoxin [Nocardioidaceae bacterium]|nr:peroxiredoxin [Nocardioidaceae bacterium]
MTVEIGRPAPDFTLRDQHGADVALESYRGSQAVLLMFYPFAFSRVCTGELEEIRDNLDDLASDRSQVLAVSCDPMFTLRAFADRDGLSFPLLSDFWPHGAVSTDFGVFDPDRGCSARSTFVIDRDGVLRWSVHNPMGEARDLAEYVRVLDGLTG